MGVALLNMATIICALASLVISGLAIRTNMQTGRRINAIHHGQELRAR